MINARAETVHEKPAYRAAFKSRRCLIPVDGFFEWFPTEQLGRTGKPLKQPFYITPADGQVLPLAGLYELWKDPSPAGDADPWLTTFTIITTTATDDVGRVHDRMPMSVTSDNWADWLNPELNDKDAVHALMAPPEAGSLSIYAVSKSVNNVRNNGPDLLDPISTEDE